MHKIKEIMHKDSEDSNALNNNSNSSYNNSSYNNTTTHQHGTMTGGHNHAHTHDNGSLSTRQFEEGHVHHGEIEHGLMAGGHQHQHQHQHLESHSHSHSLDRGLDSHSHAHSHAHASHSHSHEKHIMHEREVLDGGNDLYRAGYDPALNREVASSTTHSGGVSRELVTEGKIIKETIKEVELHKIQPVVHRDREQKEIRHVLEPHKKVEIRDTTIHHRERDIDLGVRREASTLDTSRSMGHAPHMESSREILSTDRQHQELPTLVQEHVHRKVEEHIHPVVYKEILKPKVTEETHHIYETVKEMPIETYEVKDLGLSRSRGDGLLEAEREFFSRESSRGIVLGEGHSCSRDMDSHHHHGEHHSHHQTSGLDLNRSGHSHSHEHSHLHSHDKALQHHDHDHSLLRRSAESNVVTHSHGLTSTEPIIGHHQNIGAHHLAAGAVPAGHNTAYDAALCNQCTDNPICSHSVRDAARMEKANEKKILKDEKLADKQSRKMNKGHGHKHNTVV